MVLQEGVTNDPMFHNPCPETYTGRFDASFRFSNSEGRSTKRPDNRLYCYSLDRSKGSFNARRANGILLDRALD